MIFDKLAPIVLYPLGLAMVLCFVAVALSRSRFPSLPRLLVVAAILLLWLASTPAVARFLTNYLEAQVPQPASPLAGAPADVIVVLWGGLIDPLSSSSSPALGPSADRLAVAARLWRQGKGRLVLISAGNLPWSNSKEPEAASAARPLEDLGVPSNSVLLETASRNTHENALQTLVIWHQRGFSSGYLVTSAVHMWRAIATFRAVGLELIPMPADFHTDHRLITSVFDLLPDAGALAETTAALKEIIGYMVYRLRGWA